jgi:hypothetical protein
VAAGGGRELPPHPLQAALHLSHHRAAPARRHGRAGSEGRRSEGCPRAREFDEMEGPIRKTTKLGKERKSSSIRVRFYVSAFACPTRTASIRTPAIFSRRRRRHHHRRIRLITVTAENRKVRWLGLGLDYCFRFLD